MEINELIKTAHSIAKEKGWHDKKISHLEFAALVHSEISEFVEDVRDNIGEFYYLDEHKNSKPRGKLIEIADVVIRIADYCGAMGWDLESAIEAKMEFNKTRPYRHGGKSI